MHFLSIHADANLGCVAKTGVSLVEVAKVPTVARSTDPVHEPQAPLQVASFPIRHYPVVCSVVPALSPDLPQLGRDDAGGLCCKNNLRTDYPPRFPALYVATPKI
jgi:hypothetical protein